MARADFAAKVPPVAMCWQKPEDVGLLGGWRQIELVSHFVWLSFRSFERGLRSCEVAVSRADMGFRQARPTPEKLLAQRSWRVVALIDAALLQFGDQVRDDVAERLVRHRIGEIEAVDISLVDPLLQQIRHGLRAANEEGAQTADADPFGQLAHSPNFAGIGARKRLNR